MLTLREARGTQTHIFSNFQKKKKKFMYFSQINIVVFKKIVNNVGTNKTESKLLPDDEGEERNNHVGLPLSSINSWLFKLQIVQTMSQSNIERAK